MKVLATQHIIEFMYYAFVEKFDFNLIVKYGAVLHNITKNSKMAAMIDILDIKIALKYMIDNDRYDKTSSQFYELCHIYASHQKKERDYYIAFDNKGGHSKISNIKALRNLNRESIILRNLKNPTEPNQCSDDLRHCRDVMDMAHQTTIGPFTKENAEIVLDRIEAIRGSFGCHPCATITTSKRNILYP